MSQSRDFQITLPSNASMGIYPTNKPQLFRTELPVPLNLQGGWEVAIIDIQYPYKWKNILTKTTVEFHLNYKNEDDVSTALQEADIEDDGELEHPAIQKAIANLRERDRLAFRPTFPTGVVKVILFPGNYPNIQSILSRLEVVANEGCRKYTKEEETVQLIFDEVNDRIRFKSLAPDWNIRFEYDINSEIAKILSFNAKEKAGGIGKLTLPFKTSRSPYFERTSSVFIYSDIVQHQIVGDSLVQLLGVAPVKGNLNEQYYWAFNPIMYRPLSKSYIKDIEIQLCSSDGQLIPIMRGNTIIRLHFQKSQNTI